MPPHGNWSRICLTQGGMFVEKHDWHTSKTTDGTGGGWTAYCPTSATILKILRDSWAWEWRANRGSGTDALPKICRTSSQRQRFPVACNLGSGKPLGAAELGVQSVVSCQLWLTG